jgi:hypothetical protein
MKQFTKEDRMLPTPRKINLRRVLSMAGILVIVASVLFLMANYVVWLKLFNLHCTQGR